MPCGVHSTWPEVTSITWPPLMGWECTQPAGRWPHLRPGWTPKGTSAASGSFCCIICFQVVSSFPCPEPGNKAAHCGGTERLSNRKPHALRISQKIQEPPVLILPQLFCVCWSVGLPVRMCACECVCMWVLEIDMKSLPQLFPSFFLQCGLSWKPGLWLGWLAGELQGTSSLHFLGHLPGHLALSTFVLGIKLRSSCWPGKHVAGWVIPPGLWSQCFYSAVLQRAALSLPNHFSLPYKISCLKLE